ncbi:hypothetical protein LTR37_016602 [Vermiconidia calcicola]|uniref:Uncharacterized protein n=1 Tax=Vermiconidia calcicola TaxID=1690605 RepID=A0ACC3MNC1_9PEZI|nr:hypothetical protein LTR37_016602 [Vermiconidia calcicola]
MGGIHMAAKLGGEDGSEAMKQLFDADVSSLLSPDLTVAQRNAPETFDAGHSFRNLALDRNPYDI